MVDDLLRLTSEYFDSVNFSELDEAWIDEVIENEFTDVEECKTDTNVLFAGDPLDILKNICLVCDGWTFKPVEDDFDESDAGNISARPDKVLWTYLDSMDITVKQICVLIYCLCSKAMKINSSHEDKKIGLLSAKWYFGILRVPGSSAYSVFNSNLFRLCVDCFQVADLIDCKDALFKWRDFESLFPTMISALQSLVPLMNTCHFGTDSSTTDHVIHKLSELVVSEISNPKLNFDLNFLVLSEKEFRRKYSWSYVLTCLAYQGLTSLINSDLNGEKEHNFETVLSVMNNHILCVKTKKAPIPVKFVTIKENAVSFICHHLEENKEFSSKLTQTTLKRLCFSVIDRADFRQTVAKSILAIMLHLKVEDIAEFIQWLLLLVDAHDMNNRVFGIEILGFLIETLSKIDKEGLPESLEVYLSPIPIIFAILTRCDDNSPSVRSKALSVLAQNMKGILEILVIQEPSLYLKENFSEDVNNFDQNGEHRLFWYNFSSFEEIADEIMSILHRRMDDNNGTARKSALHALENIMSFKSSFLLDENLKLFLSAAKDPNIAMRKQTVQSLTGILNIYPNDIKAQESWLKCIMPLIQDPENSVQTKVLDVIEGKFLQTILSDKKHERDGVFQLLEKLTRGKFLSHQRYLQKAFCFWQKEKKLRPQLVMKLEKLFGSDADELIWFYLSMYAAFCKLPPKMCEHAVEEFQKEENWENWTFMENVLKVIKWTFSDLHPERLENVINMLKGKIEDFVAPVEIAPLMIEILSKIEKHLGRSDTFAQFGEKMVKIAMNTLTPFISRKKSHKMPTEDIAIESLILIREFCHLFPRYITTNLTVLLKSFVYTRNGSSGLNSKQISVELRAHAFAALGKLSLQHETLGRELLPVLAKELMTSKEDMLRNNAYLILIEMCKRYTSHADKYIPIINMCFRDRRYIVRFQSITLLVSLLQEEFIKSKGTLLYCLLATVIDKIEEIQELGKYCLCSLLYEKKKTIFADHFLDAIYVFNNYPPPDNERVSQIVRELKKFAIMYDGNREKRMQIYKFMLNCMEPSSRAYVVNTICQDILTSVAEAVFPINRVTSSVVRDCFAVLNSKEIRAFNTDQMSSEFEDGEEEQAVKAELELRKVVLVQPVIPVLISLKNCIMEKKSDLLEDLVQFLKDILADYKHEINELLAEDTMLRMQVQLELRNESNLLEKEAKEKKKENNAKKPTSQSSKGKLAEQIMEVSAYLIQKNRDSFCPNENKEGTGEPKDVTLRNILQTPRNKSTASKIDYEDINLNENDIKQLSTSGAQSARRTNVKEAIFSSTPHVLLKPLKFKSPNVSRISVSMDDIDLDSD